MLAGFECAWPVPMAEGMLTRALSVLEAAAFVGITEEWRDSMCLWQAMYGTVDSQQVFGVIRNTGRGNPSYHREDALHKLTPADDPWDWRLYTAALRIFRKRQRLYGIPACRLADDADAPPTER